MMKSVTRILLGAVVAAVIAAPASAQEDFYRGKRITIIVGSGAGGAYDFAARILAEHMGKFISGNPTFIVQNMAGAGSRIAMNYLYKAAQDGTVIGTGTNLLPFDQFVFPEAPRQYDVAKFQWIGNMASLNSVIAVWHTSSVRTLADAKKTEVILGANSRVSETYIVPAVLNAIAGTKFKIVHGFPGNISDVDLAIERGEVQGRGSTWASFKALRPEWVNDKKIIPIVQLGAKRSPDMPDVPLLIEVAENDEQRAIFNLLMSGASFNRAYAAPPDVPADRVAILRKGFMDTVTDKGFLAYAESKKLEVVPSTYQEVTKVIADIQAAMKPEYLAKIRPILQQE